MQRKSRLMCVCESALDEAMAYNNSSCCDKSEIGFLDHAKELRLDGV